jgi:PIN domain nuclease of toxin-antitoxin system
VILLDSHVLLWMLLRPEQLSTRAAAAIRATIDTGQPLAASVVSIYELGRAIHRGRVSTIVAPEEFLRRAESYAAFLPVSPAIAIAAAQLPASVPADPFDRIITATAIVERLPLVTADSAIRRSRIVQTIW